jgi:CheY-like chemotaxis protein
MSEPLVAPQKNRCILLVDDEPAILECVKRGLRVYLKPIRLLTAENGKDAVKILAEEDVDLVVTDLMMPEMDGFALVEHIGRRHWSIPVVVMSGFLTGENLKRLDETGSIYHIVAKPCAMGALKDCIENAFLLNAQGKDPDRTVARMLKTAHIGRVPMTLRVSTGKEVGYLYVEEGILLDARTFGGSGERAALDILRWKGAEITTLDVCGKPRVIGRPLADLLEEALQASPAASVPAPDSSSLEAAVRLAEKLQFAEARDMAVRYLAEHRDSVQAWLWLARTARTPEEARVAYGKAARSAPEDPEIQWESGRLERNRDRLGGAVRHCPFCFGLVPSESASCCSCGACLRIVEGGLSLEDTPLDISALEKAAARLERVVEGENTHRHRYYLALARMNLGQAKEALHHMREAVRLAPEKQFFQEQLRDMTAWLARCETEV